MKIVKIAPLTLTVELDPTDCIALYVACTRPAIHGEPEPQLDATAAALLLALLAIADPHMDETPPTIAKVWRLPVPQEYQD